MARAASGAGVLAAPNSWRASGPRLMGFFLTGFLAAGVFVRSASPSWARRATEAPIATESAHSRLIKRIPQLRLCFLVFRVGCPQAALYPGPGANGYRGVPLVQKN